MIDKDIMERCELSLQKYQEVIQSIKWSERSILDSEGFLVCSMMDFWNIDLFMESGVYEGKSTEVWGSYLYDRNTPVIATDVAIRDGVDKRLERLTNVSLVKGDGCFVIPTRIRSNMNKRIGVFIDGPKGEVAVNLAMKLIAYDSVKFVAVHDCHKMSFGMSNYTRTALEVYEGYTFFSDNLEFVSKYSKLDKGDIGKFDVGQGMRWYPGELRMDEEDTRVLGSYGPTVGVIFSR